MLAIPATIAILIHSANIVPYAKVINILQEVKPHSQFLCKFRNIRNGKYEHNNKSAKAKFNINWVLGHSLWKLNLGKIFKLILTHFRNYSFRTRDVLI